MTVNIFGNALKSLYKKNPLPIYLSIREMRTRHRNSRFMIMNTYQPWPQPPNIKEIFGDFDQSNPAEMRDFLRRSGMLPKRVFSDRAINFSCTEHIINDFVPPEGDGKSSLLSLTKLKESKEITQGKMKNMKATKTIRKYEADFDKKKIIAYGESIYREVLTLLPKYKNNEARLLEFVTEKGLCDMLRGLENKTLVHTFHKHLEKPSIISIRTEQGLTEGIIFAQVVIRFFSEQTIAVFDKFGRLIYGNHELPQDFLEYVVFERQISEEYSRWRIHGKIVPDWLPKKLVYRRTSRMVVDDDQKESVK